MVTLNMPLFVSVEDVILRLSLNKDLDGIEDTVRSGIIASQLHVQRLIDGEFVRKARTVRFHLDRESFSGVQPGKAFRIEVPSGFIRTDSTFSVQVTLPANDTTLISVFSDYTDVDPTLMLVDYERGYIQLDARTYADCFVKVTCETGFEGGDTPTPTDGLTDWSTLTTYVKGDLVLFSELAYVCLVGTSGAPDPATDTTKWAPSYLPVEQVPAPLYEAVMAVFPVIFNSAAEDKEKQIAFARAERLVEPYMRLKGLTFRPI